METGWGSGKKEDQAGWTHTCNPSYSGDGHQEDRCLKPIWANSSRDPISEKKKTITKRDWWNGSRCKP
jgi:hypothetical protein